MIMDRLLEEFLSTKPTITPARSCWMLRRA